MTIAPRAGVTVTTTSASLTTSGSLVEALSFSFGNLGCWMRLNEDRSFGPDRRH